jgi:7-cyano-7-deazaguanine tRNA-ribosyltransferase
MFELLDRDAAARLGKWTVGKHAITTPNIALVINPNRLPVSCTELKRDFKADLIITNAYIISRSQQHLDFETRGIQEVLGWQGPVYTDSGTYQMWSQKVTPALGPKGIIEYEQKIGSDVITPLDVFTTPKDGKAQAKRNLVETLKRIKAAKQQVDKRALVGPIQGGRFLDMRAQACRQVAKLEPDVFAVGGIVPFMESYRFAELVDILLTCKGALPANAPIHAFGAGHPMTFALLASFGADLFDSAMYALAAERGAYLTVNGTLHLNELSELPCSCPECVKTDVRNIKSQPIEARSLFLARHNLYVTLAEMRTVRTAIRQGWLWELVQQRVRAHPGLLTAYIHGLHKHRKLLQQLDPVSKSSALLWSGAETSLRPEVLRAQEWLRRVKARRTFELQPFGRVPAGLKSCYPFGQSVLPDKHGKVKANAAERVANTLDYQFGRGAAKPFRKVAIESSRKTGRLRRLWTKDKQLLGTFRPSDGFFLPTTDGAKLLGRHIKKVGVTDLDVAKLIAEGKVLFAKFAKPSAGILPGEEVAVVSKNKLLATGHAKLNSIEMKQMQRGVAVDVRAV